MVTAQAHQVRKTLGALGEVPPAVFAIGAALAAVGAAIAYGAITRDHRWRRR